ncbi:MAG TPA: hypothetical protein VJ804_07010, partial [Acidimicrobiales bacterium]|nr:hypothetical protein [Acidimicrobiales bacterium]
MTVIEVRRARLHHRHGDGRVRARVERALTELDLAEDGPLEAALAGAGIGTEELVVVPRLAVPIRIAGTDDGVGRMAHVWADALATAVVDAVRTGDAVRYRSRGAALEDIVLRAGRGDLRRAWAWVVLGLWPSVADQPGTDVAAGLSHALSAEPRLAPAVVRSWVRRDGAARVRRGLTRD